MVINIYKYLYFLAMFQLHAFLWILTLYFCTSLTSTHSHSDLKNDPRSNGDLALWIDEKQVKMFSGL